MTAHTSPLLRDTLATTFDGALDIDVAASVGSLSALVTSCRAHRPSVVLAGTAYPDGDLVKVIADVLSTGARVLIIFDSSEAAQVPALLFAGASGCLLVRDAGPAEVVAATLDLVDGHATLHPAVAGALLQQWRTGRCGSGTSEPSGSARVRLTTRETDVLNALARGLSARAIGRELAVSPKTVDAHVSRVLVKLGAANRAQAVAIAQAHRLVNDQVCGDS